MTQARTLALASSVARYHGGCLRVIGAQNIAQTDVRTARKAAYPCDLGQLADTEELMRHGVTTLAAPERPVEPSPEEQDRYQQRLAVWERLRELAAKAAVESHQKEVVYGGPLLCGVLWKKTGSTCEPVLAPLFLQGTTVGAQPDGSVLIAATDEPPRFNTSVWANAFHKAQADQIVTLGIDAQADLADGWDDERLEELLRGINAVFPGLARTPVTDTLGIWPERPSPSQAAKLQPHLRPHDGAAVYLANKFSPYLLADLDRIAEDPEPFLDDDRPLSVMLNPPAEAVRPELEHLDIHEVLFPFPSNGPQRRTADAVDKNRIVVVQGPPGNGKSLTIANLVAHLVAGGKSVLVCSHKEQALTVVRDKLDEMGLRFLYASMVGTSASAKRELQGQIQDVKGFFARVNQHTLRRQLKQVTERRRRNGEHYQELRDDFNDRAEVEQAEAERLVLSIEGVALLPAADPVVAGADRDLVAAGLGRLAEFAREHRGVWADLCEEQISSETDSASSYAALTTFLDLQAARLDAATNAEVYELVCAWQPSAERDPEQVDAARLAVRTIADALGAPLATIGDDPEPSRVRAVARELAANDDLLAYAKQSTDSVSSLFQRARGMRDARNLLPAEAVSRRQEVVAYHAQLSSLLKRKAARRWLNEHVPGAAGLVQDEVRAWAGFWAAWETLRDQCDALGGELRLDVPARYDATAVTTYLARMRRAIAVADALDAARVAARTQTRLRLSLEPIVAGLTRRDLDEHVERWERALSAVGADRAGNEQLEGDPSLTWLEDRLRALDAAVDQTRHDDAAQLLADLRAVAAALPGLAERARILAGPTGTLDNTSEAIESAAAREGPPPAFLADLTAAFDAQPIVHRLAQIYGAITTRELADELRELRETILADAGQYLSLSIQRRIYEGFRRPTFTASLERFRKAISTSAKRFDRLEELKNAPDFDVDVLTEVFPCWIMRPEDACRMFPLRHDIFDVVIFDEASQCNPDQTLPIFARAQHAVIFGDDNQLSNEDLKRSLSGDANKALLTQSGLAELDPQGLFDQTENSLLGLASSRDQAPTVLTEHFRCRPELVAFSNNRFYADGLRVMRDGEDDRGLGPAIVIHELAGVPPLGRGKVNPYEARRLVDELCGLLEDPRYDGLTIGVLSLFREQIEHLEGLVEERVTKAVREQRRLICSTVDGFQGDERDVILYSWRYSTSQSPSILSFTNGRTGDQRVNVALTRARHQALHFISAPVESFPTTGNVAGFLRHAVAPERLLRTTESLAHKEPLTEARTRAARALHDVDLGVVEQFVACGVAVDLVVHDPITWARVAVFVDGELDPRPPPIADRRVDAQGLLERAGWTVERILAADALGDPESVVSRVQEALQRCGPRERPDLEAQRHFTEELELEPVEETVGGRVSEGATNIAPEDYADYHWPAPSVAARLAAGEDVFQSDFERELHDQLAQGENIKLVPQWRSRGKFIDLVVTDRAGRRLAIEADGGQHHETVQGALIPEDVHRQELLEEVGWAFHRVRHADFVREPDRQIDETRQRLDAQPPNARLAAEVWGDAAVLLESLEEAVPPAEGQAVEGVGSDSTSLVGVPLDKQVDPGPEGTAAPIEIDDPSTTVPTSDAAGGQPGADLPVDVAEAEAGPSPEGRQDAGAGPVLGPDQMRVGSVRYSQPEQLPLDPEAHKGAHLHEVPLAILPQQIAMVVREHGELREAEIASAYAERFSIEVPRNRHRLLSSFAWSAGGRGFIKREDDSWLPGAQPPAPIEHVGSWTLVQLETLMRELLGGGVQEHDLFDRALEIVWAPGAHTPRPIAKAIGTAIYAVLGKRVQ